MNGPTYLPPYHATLQDQPPGGQQVFASAYHQSLQPSYGISMDYSGAYHGSNEYSARTPPLSMSQDPGMMYQMPTVTGSSVNGSQDGGSHVRVVQSRPKPRCWEHGCNGRQFSTFSNLLRHQREKSGQAAKAMCPNCGAEFTRTTARNGHLLHDKCKQRRNKDTVP
ncbi:hypothetical protein HIM_02521 [Hirsutella minnesotensis 3608]|nr:hypothetical protein HIM_02521 [Hirsutella minnesotensis 3608]